MIAAAPLPLAHRRGPPRLTAFCRKKVLRYAREICDWGLARSVMEIDDRWQTRYGDIEFDPRKFPDPKAMVDELHALGFKVRGGGGRVQAECFLSAKGGGLGASAGL